MYKYGFYFNKITLEEFYNLAKVKDLEVMFQLCEKNLEEYILVKSSRFQNFQVFVLKLQSFLKTNCYVINDILIKEKDII